MAASTFQESAGCDVQLYECGPLRSTGTDHYDRHLVFDHVITREANSQRERFEAIARTLRDLL